MAGDSEWSGWRDKKFSENTRQENVACSVVFFGIIALAVTVPLAIYLLSWLYVLATCTTMFAIGGALMFLKRESDSDEPLLEATGRLSVESDYFMPFCVCPKCDVEALHWMSEPDTAEAAATIARFQRRVDEYHKDEEERWARAARTFDMRPYWRAEKPKETPVVETARNVLAGRIHVIRTCREPECGHEWGQKIWAPDADIN